MQNKENNATMLKAIHDLGKGLNTRLDGIDERLDGMDKRFDGIDGRLDGIDGRLDSIEEKADVALEAVQGLATHMDTSFEYADKRLESLERHMATRSHVEQQFRKMNGKLDKLLVVLHKKDVISKADILEVQHA